MKCASLTAATVLLAMGLGLPAGALTTDLVTNGSFETGSFSGWSFTGNTRYSSVYSNSYYAQSGADAAWFGSVKSNGYLSQTLATTVDQTYQLSFWLSNLSGNKNDFSASIDGSNLLSLRNASSSGYRQYTYDFTATSNNTVLSFAERNNPSYWLLDNVSVMATGNGLTGVAAVPLPATGSLLLLAIGGIGLMIRRARRAA